MNSNGYFRVGYTGRLTPKQLIEVETALQKNMYLGVENGELKAKVKGYLEKIFPILA